jgi:hypothetical protein
VETIARFDERAVGADEAGSRGTCGDQAGRGEAELVGDPGFDLGVPTATGHRSDHLAQDDEVRVGVVMCGARRADPARRLGDGDQFMRGPGSLSPVADLGPVDVLRQPARVLEEVSGRDANGIGEIRHVRIDPCVEVQQTLRSELHDHDRHEDLRDAADVPGHVGIDRPAPGVGARPTARADDDGPLGIGERDPRTDELARPAMRGKHRFDQGSSLLLRTIGLVIDHADRRRRSGGPRGRDCTGCSDRFTALTAGVGVVATGTDADEESEHEGGGGTPP